MDAFPARRFGFSLALSIALHTALFMVGPFKRPPEVIKSTPAPLVVRLEPGKPGIEVVEPEASPPARPPAPAPKPSPPKPPQVAKAVIPLAPPSAAKSPFALPPPDRQPRAEPSPPSPPAPPTAPPVDMLAMIESRREARRRMAQAAGGTQPTNTQPKDDPALNNIKRNLRTLNEDGTGGVFQVLEKTPYHASFAFNGWQQQRNRQWREVIEVDVKPGDDIERAIVVRMIELIRTHYSGDFQWESHRLDRVVVLSARPADQPGLEEFLMREFFGTPVRAMR